MLEYVESISENWGAMNIGRSA